MQNNKPAVLVIGAGMYVSGRDTDGFGTVLPTLVQAWKNQQIGEIYVAGTSPDSIEIVQTKLSALNECLGTNAIVHGAPKSGAKNSQAYRELLAKMPRPACAIVVTPDHLHAEITKEVIDAGVYPLVVKPLTPTVAEARELIASLRRNNLYGAVEFHKRFDEANLLLRRAVAEGRLGDIRYVAVEFSQRRGVRDVFGAWVDETNIFQYLGVHYVDMIHFVTGALPGRVTALGAGQGTFDSIQALIEWKAVSGETFSSTINTNWIDPNSTTAMSEQKIMMVGTRGRYETDQKRRGVQLITEEGGVEELNPYFTQIYRDASDDMIVSGYGPRSIELFLRDVTKLCRGELDPEALVGHRPSFQQALVSTAVVEAVNSSLSKGSAWIDVQALLKG